LAISLSYITHSLLSRPTQAEGEHTPARLVVDCNTRGTCGPLEVYCDQKVANREIRVWHIVIENGY
jgi:hypothetical protein